MKDYSLYSDHNNTKMTVLFHKDQVSFIGDIVSHTNGEYVFKVQDSEVYIKDEEVDHVDPIDTGVAVGILCIWSALAKFADVPVAFA